MGQRDMPIDCQEYDFWPAAPPVQEERMEKCHDKLHDKFHYIFVVEINIINSGH
jgi:hypothetical protein